MIKGLRATTVKLDTAPPAYSLIPAAGGVAWLTDHFSLVGRGPSVYIDPGTGPDRFRRGAQAVADLLDGVEIHDEVDLPGSGPVAFGSWTFDEQSPGSRLIVPSTIFGYGDGIAWKTTLTFDGEPLQPAPEDYPRHPDALDPQGWMRAVEIAVDRIVAGDLAKVVLARRVEVEAAQDIDQSGLAHRLSQAYPGCFTFCFEDLVGASPELLVRRIDDLVDSVPLAGSTRRGSTPGEDRVLGRALKGSHKNLAEHALAVETVMTKLRPWCSELIKEPEPSLLLLANLQHLSTKIQGRLLSSDQSAGPPNSLVLAGALHPTAAVCGVPQDAALGMIRKLEGFDRGRYSGPVGWMDHRGDGEWAVALRCALITGTRAELYAGAGIVAESDPVDELEETTLKLLAVLDTLP